MTNEKKFTFKCSNIPNTSFKYFQDLKNKKQLCDITLQIGSESISAHHIIITAVIPYFRGILKKDKNDINISNVEPDVLKCLIEFAYSYEVHIDAENVRNLLTAACCLGVDEVRDACCDFLIDSLECDNVLSIRELAVSLECTKLLKCTDYYIRRNFEKVSQTKGFMQCPLTYLEELIGKDDINVDNEEKVLEAVMNWIKNSPDERGAELPQLMRKVRMPLLDPLYLTKIMERKGIISSSLLCRDLIDEAKNYVLFPELRKSTCSFITTSRRSISNGEQSICSIHGEMKFTAQHFDLVEKKWHHKETRTFPVYGWSSAAVNNKMYFFYKDGTKEYDLANNHYKDLRLMPRPAIYATATASKNQIYVCGGKINSAPCNAVQRFDPAKNEWKRVCSMKMSCWGPSSVALDDYIFVLGGKGAYYIYGTVEKYDTVTRRWKFMSSLLTARYFADAATLNGKIYICGGYVYTSITNKTEIESATAEVYDPTVDRWIKISNMTTARSEFTLLSLGSMLYTLGGIDSDWKYVKTIGVYDPHDDSWTDETLNESEEVGVSRAVLV